MQAVSRLIGCPMAIIRPSFSRLAASCVELDSARRLLTVESGAVNGGHGFKSTFGEGPRRFKNSLSRNAPYALCTALSLRHTAGRRSGGIVRSHACPNLRGFLTAAGSATGDAGSTRHVLRVPSLGDSITEGTVVEWRHSVGSVVQAEEVVCVLETDKVSVDILAEVTGRIVSIAVEVGGTAFVGGDLAIIEPLSSEVAASEPDSAPAAPETHAAPVATQCAAGSCTGESRFGATDSTAASADSPSGRGPRKPRILFRSMRNKLERLGILPPERQEKSPTETKGNKQEKQETKRVAEKRSGATVVTYSGLEDLPAFLLRPPLSPEEIEAINDGGMANLDAAARAWTVSLSFQPVPAAVKGTKSSKANRAAV